MAKQTSKYVTAMVSTIDQLAQKERESALNEEQKMMVEDISNDQLEVLEANKRLHENRADRVEVFKEVEDSDMVKLRLLIPTNLIEELSNDSKCSRHVKHIFRALARTDKIALNDGHANVARWVAALIATNANTITIRELESALKTNKVRHAKLFASVFTRLGATTKVLEGKALTHLEINKDSKVYKRIAEMYQ